jgi:hypothetical protein
MRATTPACPMGPVKPMPMPKFQISQMVQIRYSHKSDKSFFIKTYLRHLIRKARKIHQSLRRGGYMTGTKLHDTTKDSIRDCIRVLSEATEAQIIGIKPHSMYTVDCTTFNECYVGGVSGASSPLDYHYQVLIRFKDSKGNSMAMITGIPIGSENSFIST